jgi:hypothetical protein
MSMLLDVPALPGRLTGQLLMLQVLGAERSNSQKSYAPSNSTDSGMIYILLH